MDKRPISTLKLDSSSNKFKSATNSSSQISFETIDINRDFPSNSNNLIKRSNDYITTLSNAIQSSGGLTSYSDISKIELIRDIPIGKGGGKKIAIIDFQSYINEANNSNDLRLFDGDSIFIPSLQEKNTTIIPNSILSGLSPRFITVSIRGLIESPGNVTVPLEGSLADVMNITGPRKPLSGKIYLIRYNQDGTILRKNINYSSKATPGSLENPYLVSGDLITVKNSFFGRSASAIRAVTAPFIGIYAARQVVEDLTGE